MASKDNPIGIAKEVADLISRLMVGGANLNDQQSTARIMMLWMTAFKHITMLATVLDNQILTVLIAAIWTPMKEEAELLASYAESDDGISDAS